MIGLREICFLSYEKTDEIDFRYSAFAIIKNVQVFFRIDMFSLQTEYFNSDYIFIESSCK